MDLIKELQQWKSDLEELGIEKGKAEGRLEQAMADLKATGFDSIEEAKVELDRLVKQKEEAEAAAVKLMEDFKVKYAEHIEE